MKKLLIVVDYQEDFTFGSLGCTQAIDIEKNIIDKINQFRNNNDNILFTMDTHDKNYLNTYEGRNLPIEHCIINTKGHELSRNIKALTKDEDIFINKYSFGSIELIDYLKNNNYTHIEICGVVTNICVISNAILAKTALPEADIYIIEKACGSNDNNLHNQSINILQSLQFKII